MAYSIFVRNDNDVGIKQVTRSLTGVPETTVTANVTFKDLEGEPIPGLIGLECEYQAINGEFSVVVPGSDIEEPQKALLDIEGTGAWLNKITILNAPVVFKERRA